MMGAESEGCGGERKVRIFERSDQIKSGGWSFLARKNINTSRLRVIRLRRRAEITNIDLPLA